MRLKIPKSNANIIDLIRRCGYSYRGRQGEEMTFIRRTGLSEYPRFHIYLKEEGDGFILNLHLDQKKASYAGSRAHSGEHEGELTEKEAGQFIGPLYNGITHASGACNPSSTLGGPTDR